MKVYALLLGADRGLLGIYKYLSQAQEAEYAYNLDRLDRPGASYEPTQIREITVGAAPAFDCGTRAAA